MLITSWVQTIATSFCISHFLLWTSRSKLISKSIFTLQSIGQYIALDKCCEPWRLQRFPVFRRSAAVNHEAHWEKTLEVRHAWREPRLAFRGVWNPRCCLWVYVCKCSCCVRWTNLNHLYMSPIRAFKFPSCSKGFQTKQLMYKSV